MKAILLVLLSFIAFSVNAACIGNCGTTVAPAAPVAAAADPAPVEDMSRLAIDLQAATDMACEAVSASDPSPIDPTACQCNKFLQGAAPDLQGIGKGIKGPISAAERIRVIKARGTAGDFKTRFQMACGPLVMSIRHDALSVALMLAIIK